MPLNLKLGYIQRSRVETERAWNGEVFGQEAQIVRTVTERRYFVGQPAYSHPVHQKKALYYTHGNSIDCFFCFLFKISCQEVRVVMVVAS